MGERTGRKVSGIIRTTLDGMGTWDAEVAVEIPETTDYDTATLSAMVDEAVRLGFRMVYRNSPEGEAATA